MKRVILFAFIAALILAAPVFAQSDTAQLEARIFILEQIAAGLQTKLDQLNGAAPDEPIQEAAGADEPDTASKPAAGTASGIVHRMNEVVATSKGEFTLTRATVEKGILKIAFTMNNTSGEKVVISDFNFTVKNDAGTMLSAEYDCEPQLLGVVEPGGQLSGNICYRYEGEPPLKVYYEPAMFGDEIVVWELSR